MKGLVSSASKRTHHVFQVKCFCKGNQNEETGKQTYLSVKRDSVCFSWKPTSLVCLKISLDLIFPDDLCSFKT